MVTEPECHVSGILAALFRFNRFFGVAPFNLVKQGSGCRARVSPKYSVCGYVGVAICNVITLYSIIVAQSQKNTDSLQELMWAATTVVEGIATIVVTSACVAGAPRRWRTLLAQIGTLQKVNRSVGVEDWPALWNRRNIILFLLWIVTLVVADVADCLNHFVDLGEVSMKVLYLSYKLYRWIKFLDTMQFLYVVWHVRATIHAVNGCLEKLLLEITDVDEQKPVLLCTKSLNKANNAYIQGISEVEVYSETGVYFSKIDSDKLTNMKPAPHLKVHQLVRAYSCSRCVVRTVDSCYGLLLFFFLGSTFLDLVSTSYFTISNMLTRVDEDKPDYVPILLDVFWCVRSLINLLLIVEPCHLTHDELHETRLLVSQLLRRTSSSYDPLAVELHQFYKVLVVDQVCYRPLQVVDMTRGLVITILINVTTYLFIFIDIQQLSTGLEYKARN